MLKWAAWEDDRGRCDALVSRFPDYSVYRRDAWGEHKHRLGWTPHRVAAADGNLIIAAGQILSRRLPFGIVLAWVPGGPTGPVDTWSQNFQPAIRSTTRAHYLYCRSGPMRKHMDEDSHRLILSGWQRPDARMSSGVGFEYSLSGT